MNNKKKGIGIFIVAILVISVFAAFPMIVSASPIKSLYLIADHHTAQFDAWLIKDDGTVGYQATYDLTNATDPAGVAIDESSKTLFVTSEFSLPGVELVDATTMTLIGTASGPTNLAGIDTDDVNDTVYAVRRNTDDLYVYNWVPPKTITPIAGFNPYDLPNCSNAFGIAFDNTTGILWVADSGAGIARAYVVNITAGTVTEDTSKSFTPSHKPVDIAADRLRGFVYTVSMTTGAGTPPGTGSTLLSKYDLANTTETTGNLTDQGVGVAVDEATYPDGHGGYVYVTISPYGQGAGVPAPVGLEVWDTSTSPWTQVQTTNVSGSPAGICVPRAAVAYKPPPAPVPTLTPIGIIALVGLLSVIAAMSIRTSIRKKRQ